MPSYYGEKPTFENSYLMQLNNRDLSLERVMSGSHRRHYLVYPAGEISFTIRFIVKALVPKYHGKAARVRVLGIQSQMVAMWSQEFDFDLMYERSLTSIYYSDYKRLSEYTVELDSWQLPR